MSSSCLITSRRPSAGLFGNSEGRAAEIGVLRVGSVGLGDLGALMAGTSGLVLEIVSVFGSSSILASSSFLISSWSLTPSSTLVSTSVMEDMIVCSSPQFGRDRDMANQMTFNTILDGFALRTAVRESRVERKRM